LAHWRDFTSEYGKMAAIEKIATLPEGEVQKLQFFLRTEATRHWRGQPA
jgi:hypothetical protein